MSDRQADLIPVDELSAVLDPLLRQRTDGHRCHLRLYPMRELTSRAIDHVEIVAIGKFSDIDGQHLEFPYVSML